MLEGIVGSSEASSEIITVATTGGSPVTIVVIVMAVAVHASIVSQ